MDNKNKVASIGFLLCFMAILFGIATNGGLGTIKNFIHIPSLIVTLGGSVFAVMTTADSLDDYIDGFKSFVSAFQKPPTLPEEMSSKILELSEGGTTSTAGSVLSTVIS